MTYTCPMHPDVEQQSPGHCPKCGMALVKKGDLTIQTAHMDHTKQKASWKDYLPLIVVIGIISVTTITLSLNDTLTSTFSIFKTISYFMIGFFLTFSGFKLMDLKGFAQGYATYDLVAKKWFTYGYIYPFIELGFGLAMILFPYASSVLWLEVSVMAFSGIGVLQKLQRHEQFQCACLGTFLKVPLTKITLIEDFGMVALALILLLG